MAFLFNGTNQFLFLPSAPATAFPMTLVAWGRPSSMIGTRTFLAIGQTPAATRHRNQLVMLSTGVVRLASVSSSTATVDTVATSSTNQWVHVAGVVSSLSLRTIYLNGENAVSNTTTIGSYNTFTETGIGAQQSSVASTYENYWAGDLAEIGIWNAALTASEVASLGKGITCNQVRPQSLVFYAPLIRNINDIARGISISNTNSATVSNHPRIYV